MNLGDVRRLLLTASILVTGFVTWLFWLGFAGRNGADGMTARALEIGMERWLWIGVLSMAIIIVATLVILYLVRVAPRGFARGVLRQVQCQDCKAVFMIHDTGHRPITHVCPNCKALGIYDGKAPAVGHPPRPQAPRRIVDLGLSCQQCEHRFHVTDTGARPLRVRCPACRSDGLIR